MMVKIRWMAERLGIEKLVIKSQNLKAYLLNSDNAAYYNSAQFSGILDYVKRFPTISKIQDGKTSVILNVEGIENIYQVEAVFGEMLKIKSLPMQ